jgi:hypothetical protein
VATWAACALAACAPATDTPDVDVPTPTALAATACAFPAAKLKARLWVSGTSTPCALEVDASGATSGSCQATPGRVRTVTLDWFEHDDARNFDVVLAQAQKKVDLTSPKSASEPFTVAASDVHSDKCLDMTADQVNGRQTIDVNGSAEPVCDLDGSCAKGGALCTNLDEVCNGGDPLDPNVEPP